MCASPWNSILIKSYIMPLLTLITYWTNRFFTLVVRNLAFLCLSILYFYSLFKNNNVPQKHTQHSLTSTDAYTFIFLYFSEVTWVQVQQKATYLVVMAAIMAHILHLFLDHCLASHIHHTTSSSRMVSHNKPITNIGLDAWKASYHYKIC